MYQSIQSNFCELGEYPVLMDEEIITAASGWSKLPTVVVHPGHPGDISKAILFASDDLTGISVKTSGSNWMGSFTRKGTTLLNLSKLKEFALPKTLNKAIFKCPHCDHKFPTKGCSEPTKWWCSSRLLQACNHLRKICHHAGWRWTNHPRWTNWNPYHAMIRTTSTMLLACGWLFSGGLGGSTNGVA